jgi:hypothetical protein
MWSLYLRNGWSDFDDEYQLTGAILTVASGRGHTRRELERPCRWACVVFMMIANRAMAIEFPSTIGAGLAPMRAWRPE